MHKDRKCVHKYLEECNVLSKFVWDIKNKSLDYYIKFDHALPWAYLVLLGLPGSVQFSSVAQSCPTLCDPMNRSMPGFPVHHQLMEFTQTHVHRVNWSLFQTSRARKGQLFKHSHEIINGKTGKSMIKFDVVI